MNLPNVFQNKSINYKKDSQDIFYGNKQDIKLKKTNIDIQKKLKNIFNSTKYVYKLNVHIITNKTDFDTIIIGKTNTHLITYDNDLINIKDIIDIYEKEE